MGGWLGEHIGLRASLAFAGGMAALLALLAWRYPVIRDVKVLPQSEIADDWIGAEAATRSLASMGASADATASGGRHMEPLLIDVPEQIHTERFQEPA